MNVLRMSKLAWLALCLFSVLLLSPNRANAKLVSTDELEPCQMHVIGIYSPKNHSQDDRVFVEVKPTGKPMVVVLSGYFGAQWNIKIDEEADIRQVLIPGYFEHSVVGLPDSIPVEFITYFPKGDRSRSDYFWAYSWHSNEGRKLRSRLMEITGLEISTFQGEYSGFKFVIDGKRGETTQYQSAPETTNESGQNKATTKKLMDREMAAKLQHQKMVAQFGEFHPAVKQMEKSLELMQAELTRLGGGQPDSNDSTETSQSVNESVEGKDQRGIIEDLVRQTFHLETQLQVARIEKAEADLKRIKMQLRQRQNAADKIIADRVKHLVSQGISNQSGGKKGPDDVAVTGKGRSADELASEGWVVWRKRNWSAAEKKFESALAKDHDNQSARNGIGWSVLHQGQFDEAIKHFRMVVKKNPTHGGALNGIGQALLAQGKLDEAERELLKATEDTIAAYGDEKAVRMGVTASWYGLARTYVEKGDTARARRWIDRYLKHKPDDPVMKGLLQRLESEPSSSN